MIGLFPCLCMHTHVHANTHTHTCRDVYGFQKSRVLERDTGIHMYQTPAFISTYTSIYVCVYIYIYIYIYIYRVYRVQAAGLTRTHYKHIMAPHYPADGESASYASVYHECANLYRDFANCVYV